jgi:hypothetical protein
MVLMYGEARRYSDLGEQSYGEKFPQKVLPNAQTFVNVVQHLRTFGRFEMNKQREDRILVAEEITHNYSLFTLLFKPLLCSK